MMVDMTLKHSAQRGLAVVSSGALVVGAGLAVTAVAVDMGQEWAPQEATQAVAEAPSAADPTRQAEPKAAAETRKPPASVAPKPRPTRRAVVPAPVAPKAATTPSSGSGQKSKTS